MNIKTGSALKIGIISGIIASAFFMYFLDPIIAKIGISLLSVANNMHSSYLDRLYSEIATGDPNYAYFISININMLIVGFIFGFWAFFISLYVKTKKEHGKEKETSKDTDKEKDWSFGKIAIGATVSIVFIFVFLLDIADGYIRIKTSSSFKQHITILSPLLSQQEKYRLEAEYASMRTKGDYDALIIKINDIARKNNVKLPKNKVYPF